MFAATLEHAEAFLQSIACDQCHQPSDKLQFIGSSCKHVFCWTCINEICEGKTFPLCPFCLLPVGSHDITSATFASQLFQNLLLLKENLAEPCDRMGYCLNKNGITRVFCQHMTHPYGLGEDRTKIDITQVDKNSILSLIEPDQRKRTVEEFCFTQHTSSVNTNVASFKTAKQDLQTEESLGLELVPVPDEVTPFTQQLENVTDTSHTQMTQHMRIYDEPKEFYFFKEKPVNCFTKPVTEKKKISSRKSSDLEYRIRNRDASSSSMPHISHTPRYECNIVNAAILGSEKKLLEALENGEDANDCDNLGLTALYHAASRDSTEICKILIENGALINAHGGEYCETALHAAVRWRALNTVEYLLTRGANRRLHNLKGETPMDYIKDDEMQSIFDRISHSVQIVYPSRTLKRYSIYLSSTLTPAQLVQGRDFFNKLANIAENFESATHLVVSVTESRATEISIEILEAMVRGQFILSDEWLKVCLDVNDIVEEENFEINAIYRNGELVAKDSCSASRKNRAKMRPGLFSGCQFYFCKHRYLPFRDRDIKKLIELSGGRILGREPNAEQYVESGLKPYHAQTTDKSSKELSGLFAVYMPGQFMPRRVIEQKFINVITPLWILDCIAKFTLLPPEDR